MQRTPEDRASENPESSPSKKVELDREAHEFKYDRGGVPGFLVLIYIAFLMLLLLYSLDYLIPTWGSLEDHIEP